MGKIAKECISDLIENVTFWILMGTSIVMGIIAFFTPPMYDIPKSALSFISWMFAFASLWTAFVAIKRGIDARLSHGKTSLELNNPDSNASAENNQTKDEKE